MGTAQLRKYHQETYDYDTGRPQFTIIKEIEISKDGFDYLSTPESEETSYYEWAYLGNRYEQMMPFRGADDWDETGEDY